MKSRNVAVAAAVAGSLVAIGGLARACTAQSYIVPVMPRAVPGQELAVSAQVHGTGPVEVRWNSENGPVVGAGNAAIGREFTTSVEVPQGAEGVHYMVLTFAGAGVARTPVEVVAGSGQVPGASSRTVSADAWSGFASGPFPNANPQGASLASERPAAGTLAGVAILAVGLVGVMGGAVAAGARRRASKTNGA